MSRQPVLAPRADHPPRWALVLFALGLMAGVILLFHSFERQDEGNRVAGTPARFSRPEEEVGQEVRQPEPPRPQETQQEQVTKREQVTKLEQLLEAPSPEALVGRQVVLEEVPVLEVVGDYTFWIGTSPQARVPVVLLGELTQRQPEGQMQVRQDQRLRIFGVIRRVRDVEALGDALLSPREQEALQQARFFISASRVVPLER